MNELEGLRTISNTLLYEGCMLYPYRASALKNRRPGWTFGALLPPAYVTAHPDEADAMQSQVLAATRETAEIVTEIRFLQLAATHGSTPAERCLTLSARIDELLACSRLEIFAFPVSDGAAGHEIIGIAALGAEPVADGLFRITVRVRNASSIPETRPEIFGNRDLALNYSLLSANALLALSTGQLVSLIDPPEPLKEAAAACKQTGVFPVLAGDPEKRAAMLASPIILCDFPQVAPETRGDFFDSSEIDEMLALRVLTLSDAERAEIQQEGQAGHDILARTEALSPEEMRRMHGTLRIRSDAEGGE